MRERLHGNGAEGRPLGTREALTAERREAKEREGKGASERGQETREASGSGGV